MRKVWEEGEEIILMIFGDMYKILMLMGSFVDLKSEGFDVRIVYGIFDIYRIVKENLDKIVVYFLLGFEMIIVLVVGMFNVVV